MRISDHNDLLILLSALFSVQSYHLGDVFKREKPKQTPGWITSRCFRKRVHHAQPQIGEERDRIREGVGNQVQPKNAK